MIPIDGKSPYFNAKFHSTRWTRVLEAGTGLDARAEKALAELCNMYWQPLYMFVRQKGYPSEEAQDLTQSFFVHLLEKNSISRARKERGKFRTFLLAVLKNFLADEWDKVKAHKRGKDVTFSFGALPVEKQLQLEPVDNLTPEILFERKWAMQLLEQVLNGIRAEYEATGHLELFEKLRFCLQGERSVIPYRKLAAELALSEGALKVTVHRLRKRYRQKLREEIAQTVEKQEDIEQELAYLIEVLSN